MPVVYLKLLMSIEWSQLLCLCKVVASTSKMHVTCAAKASFVHFCSFDR